MCTKRESSILDLNSASTICLTVRVCESRLVTISNCNHVPLCKNDAVDQRFVIAKRAECITQRRMSYRGYDIPLAIEIETRSGAILQDRLCCGNINPFKTHFSLLRVVIIDLSNTDLNTRL